MPGVDQLRCDPLTMSSAFKQSIATAALSVEHTVTAAVNLFLDAQHRSAVVSERAS